MIIKIIKIALVVLLCLCLAHMPYGYYQFVRFAALIAFAYFAYESYSKGVKGLAYIYIALAILFQPLIKISLGREIWNAVDVIVAVLLLLSLFYNPKSLK